MNNQPHSKKVYQYDFDGNFINQYESLREASYFVGVTKGNIKSACEGINIHSNNFYFTYEYRTKLNKDSIPYYKKNSKKIICKFDLNGKYIEHYLSIKEAAIKNNLNRSGISQVLDKHNTCGGFIWIRNSFIDLTNEQLKIYHNYLLPKKVYQYDIYGNLIGEFNSIKDASDKLNILKSGIWSVLSNYQNMKKYKNFIFSYEKKDKINEYIKPKSAVAKKVVQYEINGKFIKLFNSGHEAERETNISSGCISACCLKKPKYYTAGGFIWRYYNGSLKDLPKKEIKLKTNKKPILQFDLNGNFIKEWDSASDVANSPLKIKHNNIGCNLSGISKSAGGFVWKYKDTN